MLTDIMKSREELTVLKEGWNYWSAKNDVKGNESRDKVSEIMERMETYVDSKAMERFQVKQDI